MSQAINFYTDFLGERQKNESCCTFPFEEGADSGNLPGLSGTAAQAVMLQREANWAFGFDP